MFTMPKFLPFRRNKDSLQGQPVAVEAFIKNSEIVNEESAVNDETNDVTTQNSEHKLRDTDDSFVNERDTISHCEKKSDGLAQQFFEISKLWPFHRYKEASTQSDIKEPLVEIPEEENTCECDENSEKGDVVEEQNNNEPSNDSNEKKYYAVYLPVNRDDGTLFGYFHCDKAAPLAELKRNKFARFKIFDTEDDAKAFLTQPYDIVFPEPCTLDNEKSPLGVSPCSAPLRSDIVELRKAIESGDIDMCKEKMRENPRYLITGVDTPTVMMEGYHYNALHIAAKFFRPEICELILLLLESTLWMSMLYPDNSEEAQEARARHLLDLYLNMPDKKLNETPLHFACKFGCYEAVKIFLSHPLCDRTRKNKYGLDAQSIICERCLKMEQEDKVKLKNKIEALFEDHYYVPVLRTEGNDIPPVIGEPYSPDRLDNFKELPYDINTSPCSPKLSVMAVAGPMPQEQAKVFYKEWKTPKKKLSVLKDQQFYHIRLADPEKGLERIGRTLAHDMKIQWTEYWQDLNMWCDFSTVEGIEILERSLKKHEREWKREQIAKKKPSLAQRSFRLHNSIVLRRYARENAAVKETPEHSPPKSPILSRFRHLRESLKCKANNDVETSINSTIPACDFSFSSPDVSSGINDVSDASEIKTDVDCSENAVDGFIKLPFANDSELTLNHPKESEKLEISSNQLCDIRNSSTYSSPHVQVSDVSEDSVLRIKADILNNVVVLLSSFQTLNLSFNISKLHCSFPNELLEKLTCLCNESETEKYTTFFLLREIYENIKDFFQNHEKVIILKHLTSFIESYSQNMSSDCSQVEQKLNPVSVDRKIKTPHFKKIRNMLCSLKDIIKCDISKSSDFTCCQFNVHSDDHIDSNDDLDLNILSLEETPFDRAAIKLDFLDCEDNFDDTKLNDIKENYTENVADNTASDFENSEEFRTAPSSPVQVFDSSDDEEEISTPPEFPEIYIDGSHPSKVDLDIYRAMENTYVDPTLYPCAARWKHLISTKDKKTIESWPSPATERYREYKSYLNSQKTGNNCETSELGQSPVLTSSTKFVNIKHTRRRRMKEYRYS